MRKKAASYIYFRKKNLKQYLNDGYVPARIVYGTNELDAGEFVYVNSVQYASKSSDDFVEVISAKTGRAHFAKKNNVRL